MSQENKEEKPLTRLQKYNHLFVSAPKKLNRVGGDFVKHDMSRYVKWPLYIRIQRQKKILKTRLKIPAPIYQFTNTVNKNQSSTLFNLLMKYLPETPQQKKLRLSKLATAQAEGKEAKTSKPYVLKFGLNHITQLIEMKKAKLVVIAADVEPIELVVWLPALCRRMGVPYTIVKSKARLGSLVHQKNATCVCLTEVRKEDNNTMKQLIESFASQYNPTACRRTGGQILGHKHQMHKKKVQREKAKSLKI